MASTGRLCFGHCADFVALGTCSTSRELALCTAKTGEEGRRVYALQMSSPSLFLTQWSRCAADLEQAPSVSTLVAALD